MECGISTNLISTRREASGPYIELNKEIKGWFDRRNIPYTETINEWLLSRKIDTPKKMKLVTMDQWKDLLLHGSDDDLSMCVYREGLAFEIFQKQFVAYQRGKSIYDDTMWLRYVLGALLAYFILFLFVMSTFYYISRFYYYDCSNADENSVFDKDFISDAITLFLELNETYSADARAYLEQRHRDDNQFTLDQVINYSVDTAYCDYLKDDQITIGIHNVTFGLVSAIVVQQLVSNADGREGLYAKFGPLLEARKEAGHNKKWYHRIMTQLILQTTRVYVVVWIVVGSMCLVFGIVTYADEGSLGMIFTTGQTWLGIAVTLTYAYFGVEEAPEIGETNNESLTNTTAEEGGTSSSISTSGTVNGDDSNNQPAAPHDAHGDARSISASDNNVNGANSVNGDNSNDQPAAPHDAQGDEQEESDTFKDSRSFE